MKGLTKLVLASTLVSTATGAYAAAFQLSEVSTSGLGMAYAGNAAVADNASVVASNPALMMQFKNAMVSVGGVYVDSDVDVSGTMSSNLSPITADASAQNYIPVATLPNLYFVVPISDRFAIGGGMNVNYGLKSEFGEEYNGGIFGGATDLTAANYNFSAAVELAKGFNFGVGINAVHSTAEISRYAGIAGPVITQATGGAVVATPDMVLTHMEGEEWSFGWSAGLSYDFNENNRLGVAYQSAVDVDFEGDFSNYATGGMEIPGNLTLNLPAYWEVAGYHRLTDKLALQYSWKYTEWSRFKELQGVGNDGTVLFHKDENFKDASRYAIGLSYDLWDELTIRAGLAYDESAAGDSPSISIPDTERTWYSIGATYRFTPNLSVDVAYAYLHGHSNSFTESETISTSIGDITAELDAKVAAHANLWGLNVNYEF